MLYNKNNVRKTNDKKILHKVGKQWKVVSVALLMAIGGTAVATHAANAQSNNSVNDNPIAVQSAVNVKPQSSANQSANSSASASASSVAPSSFTSDNAGSAASYHAHATSTMNGANSAAALVSGYVNSLNARMPEISTMLNNKMASAKSAENSDNALAQSYSAAANMPANQSAVSSLAINSGYTNASDYVKYAVASSASINDANAQSTANYSNAINILSNVAQSLVTVNWSNASLNAKSESASVAKDIAVVNAKSNAAHDFYYGTSASGSTSAKSGVSAEFNTASTALSNYNKELASASMSADIYRAINDASSLNKANMAMSNANAAIGKENGSYVALSALNSKAISASSKAAKASSALSDAAIAANYVSGFANSMSNSMKNSSAFVSSLAADYKSGKRASVEKALGLGNFNPKSNLVVTGLMASMLSNDGVNVASLYSLYNNKTLFNDMKAAASVASASMSGKSLTPANLYAVVNSMATSANSNASSAASVASAYYTNNSAALNSYYASSYATNASNDANTVSLVADEANAAYSNLLTGSANTEFNNAVALVNNAKQIASEDMDNARAFAKNVQLNAPKFITITKDGLLHKSYNYGDANDAKLGHVLAGQQYNVLGYRIDANGNVRYQIQVGNQTGYFTSNPGYVVSTYAFANAGNKYTVNVNKDVRAFSDVNRTKATGDIVKKGTSLNVIAVAAGADNYYGGYSVYEIMDGKYAGDFITSNVKSVSVPQAKANNNNASKPAQAPQMPSINF